MKNNRQIGLDGKIFVSTSMRRGTFFVFLLMLYGIVTAAADILKLTGASGVAMGSFTTTLLIYDFIVSLLLVVVVFYAYFLECGADIPVIKEKPLMIFGFFRLGYYLLLSYYICYRMLYCAVNKETVSTSVCIFYAVYLCLIVLLILANCYIFNILTRNLIRRSYKKSFHRLAVAGFIVQALLPISYIAARFLMDDIGDEYFTTAVCDLIRLLIAPMLLTSVWFLFLHAVGQVSDVYSEVDTALKNKRYQITYSSENSVKNSRSKNQTAPATATLLPAGAAASVFTDSEPKALKSAAKSSEAAPKLPTDLEKAPEPEAISSDAAESTAAADSAAEQPEADTAVSSDAAKSDKSTEAAETAADEKANPSEPDDEIVTAFASEARKAVAMTSAQNTKKQSQNKAKKASAQQKNNRQQNVPMQPALPVQEFDPYPAASVPLRTQHPQNNAQKAKQQGRAVQKNVNSTARPRPVNSQSQPSRQPYANNSPQRGVQNGQHPVQNNGRANGQPQPAQNIQQRPVGQQQRSNSQRPSQNNGRNNPHR